MQSTPALLSTKMNYGLAAAVVAGGGFVLTSSGCHLPGRMLSCAH
jgi:hypothetical protein